MLGLFKKSLKKDAQVAVCPDDSAIAVARIRRDKDTTPLLELCDVRPLESVSLQDAEIARLTRSHHLDDYHCVSTLESGSYSLLLVEAPDVQPDELKAAVRWRVKDLIDFHIDDAVVDVFEVPDQRTVGRNKMMYAVVARTDTVRQRIDQLLRAGLHLEVIDIPELALRNVTSLLPEDTGGVAFVYIGDNNGIITITRKSILYLSRHIEQGTGSLPDTPTLQDDRELIEGWLDNIIIEIQRSLDYYESHFAHPQVSSLIVAPMNRDIPGVADYLTSQLGIPARMLDVNELIDAVEPVAADIQSRSLVAIGAALRQEAVAL